MVHNCKNQEDLFIFNWNDEIYDIFIDALEKQYNFGKYNNIRFKLRAWVYYTIEVQNFYLKKKIISVRKLKKNLITLILIY